MFTPSGVEMLPIAEISMTPLRATSLRSGKG
jgi:hypothetical protein